MWCGGSVRAVDVVVYIYPFFSGVLAHTLDGAMDLIFSKCGKCGNFTLACEVDAGLWSDTQRLCLIMT